MEVLRVQVFLMSLIALAFSSLPSSINAQLLPPAPAPAPTSDGIAVDQGVAYVLMLLALVLTYIIH
ncbi:Arabinogalactan peptide [Vigna unguiculata]|uniref:Arabinogalactan peptide n=1 Tax=Vigna unguiculata TaxID=3917 RepID=A0A4D6LSI4_VIGUN|nr:Arabinogalactan peptide [Vigna unguiculata]